MLSSKLLPCSRCCTVFTKGSSFSSSSFLSSRGSSRIKSRTPALRNKPEKALEQTSKPPPKQTRSPLPRLTIAAAGGITGSFFACTYWQYRAVKSESRQWILQDDETSVTDMLRQEFVRRFRRLPNGRDMIHLLIVTCCGIFLGWKRPGSSAMMMRNFVSSLTSANPIRGMVLSSYSHYNFPHLAVNTIALLSLGHMAALSMRKEEVTFFILSAGLYSSFSSLAINALLRNYGFMSLGASGIGYAFAGYVASVYPNASFSIFPINLIYPHGISGRNILIGLLVFDVLGLLFFRHKSFLDHAGHLGGLLFGLSYAHSGRNLFRNQVRRWE